MCSSPSVPAVVSPLYYQAPDNVYTLLIPGRSSSLDKPLKLFEWNLSKQPFEVGCYYLFNFIMALEFSYQQTAGCITMSRICMSVFILDC